MRLGRGRLEGRPRSRPPPQRARRLDDRGSRGRPGSRAGGLAPGPGLYVPLILRERPIGIITAHDKEGGDARVLRRGRAARRDVRSPRLRSQSISRSVSRATRLRRVVSAQELERERLARELHDETGQALTSILLGLKSVEDAAERRPMPLRRPAELRELVVTTLQDVRRLAVELRPKALDDFGLVLGPRAPRRDVPRADRDPGRPRASARGGAPPVRGRDGALPDHPGGADERRQARAGEAREHRPHAARRVGLGGDRGRRTWIRRRQIPSERTAWASSACVSGSRWSDGRLSVESSPGSGTTLSIEVPVG